MKNIEGARELLGEFHIQNGDHLSPRESANTIAAAATIYNAEMQERARAAMLPAKRGCARRRAAAALPPPRSCGGAQRGSFVRFAAVAVAHVAYDEDEHR